MVVYSIKDMETLSGVKAHTLRIWEKRYDVLQPKRTKTNIRYYTDEDLRHLLNVCFLYKHGYKISKIANMNEEEIKNNIASHTQIVLDDKDKIDTLMMFIIELDAYNLNKIFDQYISQTGLEKSMEELIYPLLDRLSMAWLAGSFQSVHESFVTQIIKSKMQFCIEQLDDSHHFSPHYLIYLPEGEKQELSLLYLHYLLKKNKCKVVNLGSDVTLRDVISSLEVLKPDYLFTIINNELKEIAIQTYIDELTSSMKNGKFLITGYQAVTQNIDWGEKVRIFKNLSETLSFITKGKKESN